MPTLLKKIPGGKLIRLDFSFTTKRITSVHLTGDFFLYPEDTLGKIENTLLRTVLPLNKTRLKAELLSATHHATLIGFTIDDLISLLIDAGVP